MLDVQVADVVNKTAGDGVIELHVRAISAGADAADAAARIPARAGEHPVFGDAGLRGLTLVIEPSGTAGDGQHDGQLVAVVRGTGARIFHFPDDRTAPEKEGVAGIQIVADTTGLTGTPLSA